MNKRAECGECGRKIVQANGGEWIHVNCQMMHVPYPKQIKLCPASSDK